MIGFLLGLLVVTSLCPDSTLAAIISTKQHKCQPPRSTDVLKAVSIADLPFYTTLTVNQYEYRTGSRFPNRTFVLDKYFPEEWLILHLSLRRLTNRVALLCVSCPSVHRHNLATYFLLVQSTSGRTMWIKRVAQDEQHFYGFRYGWTQAFLKLDSTNEAFFFRACPFQQIRMVIEQPSTNWTSLRCSGFDTDGQRRLEASGLTVTGNFAKLARRISAGRISYPYGTARLLVLKLLVSFGFFYGYFSFAWVLLERAIR